MPSRKFFIGIGLVGLFIITIPILLLRHPSPSLTLSFSYPNGFGPGYSLGSWLLEEEASYSVFLRDRQEILVKLGEGFKSFGDQRVTLWDLFVPAFRCPHHLQRVGIVGDGGKWVCGVARVAKQERCVIYSFGVNDDSSFEASLLKRAPDCEVWGYDYSVAGWGPEIGDDPELRNRAHFQAWALGGTDRHGENDNPKYWTLDSLMKHNGHSFIDILKIDIEGAEFDALTSFIEAHANGYLPIGQLQLEIHAYNDHQDLEWFLKWWETLEAAGLRPFSNEINLVHVTLLCSNPEVVEYSFINIRGNHALVSDAFG